MIPRRESFRPAVPYLTYVVAGVRYGVPWSSVKEILPYVRATPIPGTPPSIHGVIEVGGTVVPVVDLAVKLGNGPTFPTSHACILVVEIGAAPGTVRIGILAHEASSLAELRAEDVRPATRRDGTRIAHFDGVGVARDGCFLLLSLHRVLTSSDVLLAATVEVLARPRGAPVS